MKKRVWFHRSGAIFWGVLGLISFYFGWHEVIALIWVASVYANVKSDWGAAEAADDSAVLEAIQKMHTETQKEMDLLRKEVLRLADQYTSQDRNTQYGSPENNFGTIATMWTAYLHARPEPGGTVTSYDVAAMLALLKVARLAQSPDKADHWIDLAGYAACGGEVAQAGEGAPVTSPAVLLKGGPGSYKTTNPDAVG